MKLLQNVGINSVEALAARKPRELIALLESATHDDITDARVRVWIRGAKRLVEKTRITT
jgi:hypothetical protein